MFCEHGKAPDKAIQRWQNMISPIWKCLGGGCSLNKDIPFIIEENGFRMSNGGINVYSWVEASKL